MSHFKKRFQLLLHPSFRWFVASCLFSMLGVGLSYVAMTWMILKHQNSVGSIAVLMICFWLPGILLAPFVGVFVDRYSRKKILVFVNGIRAILFIGFGWYLLKGGNINSLYLLAILSGGIFSLYTPSALKIVREIVLERELLYANALIDIAYEAGNIIGVGVAGLLAAVFSGPLVIILNGICFLISTFMLMLIPHREHVKVLTCETKVPNTFFGELKDGLQYLMRNQVLFVIYTIQLLILVEAIVTPIILAPFAKNILKLNVEQFGHIEASMSIGIIIGGLFVPWISEKLGLLKTLVILTIALALSFLIFSLNRQLSIAEVIYFVIGFALAIWPLLLTKAQHLTEFEYQGRVQSTFTTISGMIVLVIYLLLKLGSNYISIPKLYLFEVGFTFIALVLLWFCRDTFK